MTTTNQQEFSHPSKRLDQMQYIKVWGFMVNDLELKKTELMVYAVIFSFYHHRDSFFAGSREYLQGWCGSGKSAIDEALASLQKKNLIVKEYRNAGRGKRAIYYINTDSLPDSPMFELENKHRDIQQKAKKINELRSFGLI